MTTGNNGHAAGTGYDLVTGIGTPIAPGIVNLLGGGAPAVVLGSPPTGTGSPPTGGSGALAVWSGYSSSSVSRITISVSSTPSSTSSLVANGSISALVTTMDLPKVKKVGGLLSS